MVLQSERLSFTLMNHIVIFCYKLIKETNDKIDQTDPILKTKLEYRNPKNYYIKWNRKKKILHQRKFTKYNKNLKYKPEPAVKATNIIDKNENLNKTTVPRYYELTFNQQEE